MEWKGGGKPFGYVYDPKVETIVINKKEKETLLRIFDFALSGKSAYEILTELNSGNTGSQKGKEWSYKTLSYCFAKKRIEFYAGKIENEKGNWEPLISEELGQKLIELNFVTSVASRPRRNIYFLSGSKIAFCGHCGGPVKANTSNVAAGNATNYYVCSRKTMKGKAACPDSRLLNMNVVDEMILTDIAVKSQTKEKLEKIGKEYLSIVNSNNQKLLSDCDTNIQYLLTKQTSSSSAKQAESISSNISALLAKKDELLKKSFDLYDYEILTKSAKIQSLSVQEQKELLRKVLKSVTLKSNSVEINYLFPLDNKGKTSVIFEYER